MTARDPSDRPLSDWLDALARFSGEGLGVTRLAYDEAWCEAHRWLAAQAASLGLAATADGAGNLFFHDPALEPGAAAGGVLMVGSHLDTVPHGGRLDGALGVIAGLLLAAEHRAGAGRPVVGFVTCEEEESRFRAGLMGARSILGEIAVAELDDVRDDRGVSWRAALADARERRCAGEIADGPRPFDPPFRAAMMLELHVEQGPVLERERLALGVVEAIAGYRRWRARFEGAARHSGTTPMAMRHDALAAAAEAVLAAESLAREAGEPAVATAGAAAAEPGLFNVVPGLATLRLEVRHSDPGRLAALASGLEARARAIADRRGVRLELEEVSRQEPQVLSASLAREAAALAEASSLPHRRMVSGAAHDAMRFARAGVPALMVFVPSRGGVSHAPDEYTEPSALETGVRFLSALAGRLALSPPEGA